MKVKNLPRHFFIILFFCYTVKPVVAQVGNVGIGTVNPDSSAKLHVYSTDKGVLLPEVSLQIFDDAATVHNPAKYLLVVNNNDAMKGGFGQGLYMNMGTPESPNYQKLATEKDGFTPENFWSIAGNTVARPKGYLGTKDDVDLALIRNNIVSLEIKAGGSLLATGSTVSGITPASGAGSRMMWDAKHSAFRSGEITVTSANSWDDANIGHASFATGIDTRASKIASVAMGFESSADGDYSFAAGKGCWANPINSVAIGAYNVPDLFFTPGVANPTDVIFQLGNGNSYNDRRDAISVRRDGRIGINNIIYPTALLHIKGKGSAPDIWDSHIRLEDALSTNYAAITYSAALGLSLRNSKIGGKGLYIRNAADDADNLISYDNGNLEIRGSLIANGINYPSDIRLKKDIKPLQTYINFFQYTKYV